MAKLLDILTYPTNEEKLRRKAITVTKDEILTDESKHFVENMARTMIEKDGIGLAAMQVGDPRSMFVINTKDKPLVIFNPKITKYSFRKRVAEEGCLSLPDIFGLVKRPNTIQIKGLDISGNPINMKLNGLMARVAQHEHDHLNGILFIDKVKVITRGDV